MEPPRSNFAYILLAATALFAIACPLSFFTLRWAAICTLAASVLSSPLLYFGGFYWIHNLAWRINYEPAEVTARLSLIVAAVSAVRQMWLSRRSSAGLIEAKMRWWALPATFLYAIAMVAIANSHGIWDWLFRLRYGG